MMINRTCPQCGAEISVDNSVATAFCKYCGNQMNNAMQPVNTVQAVNTVQTVNTVQAVSPVQTVNVTYAVDRSNEPNLYINYMTVNPNVLMVTRIVETGQKNTYFGGQTMTFRLAPGKHVIVLKIGKVNYNRTIYIPEDNTPVKINASFSGRANIDIDQPPYTIVVDAPPASNANANVTAEASDYTAQGNAGSPVVVGERLPKSVWSVMAFILSFLVYTSPFAVVLGILDITVLKRRDKSHGMSIAAIAIGACMSMILIPIFSSCAQSSGMGKTAVYKKVVDSNADELSNKALGEIVGTYVGMDGSVLIFHRNGKCSYYYKTYSEMETNDEWMYEDNYLVWYTKDMDCNVYARLYNLDTQSLYFRSDSREWSGDIYYKVSGDEVVLSKEECDKLIAENE